MLLSRNLFLIERGTAVYFNEKFRRERARACGAGSIPQDFDEAIKWLSLTRHASSIAVRPFKKIVLTHIA
jgi:hypothetical protein